MTTSVCCDDDILANNTQAHPWVTKNGEDPLLSIQENCANLVDMPTEEEMNHAITGNMKQLLVVVRAD